VTPYSFDILGLLYNSIGNYNQGSR